MQHPYSAKLTYKAKKGDFPAMRGEIYERDIVIARFSRAPVEDGYIPPIETKFLSERAKDRFETFSDCLSIEETVEALLPM